MDGEKMFRWSVFYELGMACDDITERCELWQAIMEYGLYGKEPPSKFKRDFVNIKFILSKSKKIAYLRWKAWEQHTWNQYTSGDGKRKPNDKAQKKVVEQMEQNGTNGTKQFYSHSYSISNEWISNKYLDYVYLNNDEYMKLIDGYGEKVITDYIERLNNWIWEKPNSKDRKNRNHYFTILSWLRKDGVKKLPPKPENETWEYENLREQDVYLQNLIKWKQK